MGLIVCSRRVTKKKLLPAPRTRMRAANEQNHPQLTRKAVKNRNDAPFWRFFHTPYTQSSSRVAKNSPPVPIMGRKAISSALPIALRPVTNLDNFQKYSLAGAQYIDIINALNGSVTIS